MKIDEARETFIMNWGILGSNWGISKTMALIHAQLLIEEEPLTTEEIMEQLNISRGNVNMNVRSLIDWGLVEKVHKLGERKEFFKAEKDLWKITTRIANERRKRELEPILSVLKTVQDIEPEKGREKEIKNFQKRMKDLDKFSNKVNRLFDRLSRADEKWFVNVLLKLIK